MATIAQPPPLAFGRFTLDFADERLLGPDGPIRIGNKAFCVLRALVEQPGRLITKDHLFETVWDGAAVSESALTSVVKELRRALGDETREPRFIESVYGRGYRFVAPVHPAADPAPAPGSPAPPPAAPSSFTPTRAPLAALLAAPAPRLPSRLPVTAGLAAGAILAAGSAWWALDRREAAPVAAMAVVGTDAAAEAPAAEAGPLARSVAVLPFANRGGDARDDYFSDGMAEELRTRLSRIFGLNVAAGVSSASAKGKEGDLRAVGRQLNVGYVMTGSVGRSGDMLRIAAQLIDVRTGFQSWAQTYERPLSDIFAIQKDIAEAVTRAVQGRLLGGDAAALQRAATTEPEAYDAYVRGRALFDMSGGEETYRAALAAFDRAIALDPRYAAAHAARARTLAALANQFEAPEKLAATYAEGLKSARRAVALAPDLDEAQSTLGYLLVNGKLDFAGAREPYEMSYRLGRGNPDVLIRYGLFAVRAGRIEPGLVALRRAAQLDPLNARAFKAWGQGLYAAHRYAEAIAPLERALALNPAINGALGSIGDAYLMLGRLPEARANYRREPTEYVRLTGLAIVDARSGARTEARTALNQLVAKEGDSAAYQRAQILAQWQDRNGAFAALEAALRVGDPGMIYLRNDPLLDPLRGDGRFRALVTKLGLS